MAFDTACFFSYSVMPARRSTQTPYRPWDDLWFRNMGAKAERMPFRSLNAYKSPARPGTNWLKVVSAPARRKGILYFKVVKDVGRNGWSSLAETGFWR